MRYRANTSGHLTFVVRRPSSLQVSLAIYPVLYPRYYQVIMTIDIFQYSNMYTLRKSTQWLADEAHVKDECGPFVSKEGTHPSILLLLG